LDFWDSALWVIRVEENGCEDERRVCLRSFDEVFAADEREDEIEFWDDNATECEGEEEE
jgi:hypothetical protein